MNHPPYEPLKKPFFSPGTYVLMAVMAVGFSFGITRLLTGLSTVTNLDNSYPWGIWIAIDVACGVALAAGGFTTAALVDIFGGKRYRLLLRPAVLTAWLGYIMVAVGLMFDLGRYWNIWQPMFNWQGNSVMFELAMCVMAYLIVLTFEISPSILTGLQNRMKNNEWGSKLLSRIEKPIGIIHSWIKAVLPLLIVAGVVLSCMHQSSLGTLMVIAPTKLSALWYTPWLPLLFLLSAIMVGFPMVIIESIASSKGLDRETEMEFLSPLAAKIPWFLGVYAVFKFGDLLARRAQLDFMEQPGSTISFFIEIIMGLLVPFVLLSLKAVRRSRGWLFTSAFLVIFGVALNRINVFLVGYHPRFAEKTYFPSIGEISLTVGLIATLIFLYRFIVNYFPILPVHGKVMADTLPPSRIDDHAPMEPKMAWVFRGSAAVFLLAFVILYVVVHQKAITVSAMTYGEVFAAKSEAPAAKERIAHHHDFRPEKYLNFYILSSPILNSKTDYYEPVRFSHRTHDDSVGGDCSVCHHRMSFGSEDRVGDDLKTMHAEIEVRIGGACTTCHEDLEEKEMQKCGACHVDSNEPDYPARIGLKGAYHRQCIGCHEAQPATAYAPTDCISCHHPLTPDHDSLAVFTGKPGPRDVTAQCLTCHEKTGRDILNTAHWNWMGLTPSIAGHEHDITTGLVKVIDNYTITMCPKLVNTDAFHIGYGLGCDDFDFNNPGDIDCLVCHDTTGEYQKNGVKDGLPSEDIDLAAVAQNVGRPSRANCGSCHFNIGGGPNVKHGDLEPSLAAPSEETDVHMGMLDLRCQDCHSTKGHQVAGMSFMAPVTEGRVTCEKCHGPDPHGITGYLSRHLDDHVKAVSCEACHIPYIARETPTRISTDFSTAGQDRAVNTDANGMPDYDKKWGSLTWAKNVAPVYKWFDGTRKSYLLGDPMETTSGVLELNAPLGEKHIPQSRIFPFKVHTALQPYDTEQEILTVVKFKEGYWDHFDWDKAIKAGMESLEMTYSGKHGFVKTRMYTSLHHQVVPAKKALGCADCHQVEAITCKRCHRRAEGMDQPSHTRKVYPETPNRIDFKALGYEDDPAFIGGRFYIQLGRGKPPK